MDDRDRNPSPDRRLRRRGGACTGKSCQSCTAAAIADCVALCCCPCAVVNCFVLAFFKLPWAVARRCLRRRGGGSARRRVAEESEKCGGAEKDGGGMFEIVVAAAAAEGAEEMWLEVAEIGHLGFGRVSSARINFYTKGN